MNSYLNMPWVKPFAEWLRSQNSTGLTLIGIGLGVITIVIAIFAPNWLKLLWIAFMLSP